MSDLLREYKGILDRQQALLLAGDEKALDAFTNEHVGRADELWASMNEAQRELAKDYADDLNAALDGRGRKA